MKKHIVKIGGRDFPLAFTLKTLIGMEQTIEGFDFSKIVEQVQKPAGMLNVLYLLAETGAELEEKTLEVDRDWMALRIPVNMNRLSKIQVEIMDTLTDGMSMETEDDEDDKEVDVVLDDIKKKEATGA